MVSEAIHQSGVLNSATCGLDLAAEVVSRLELVERIELDFEYVERVTPSFANALVMTLLEAESDCIPNRVSIRSSSEPVLAAIHDAIDRYRRGLRLSSQTAPAK